MIEVKNVTKTYGTGLPAIKNLNIKIEDGEFVFVVGASGSGKSTFIKLLLRELKPTEGTIEINGEDISKLRSKGVARYRRNVGVVFQDFRLLTDRDVYSNITFAQHVIGVHKKDIKKNIIKIITLKNKCSTIAKK